MIAFLRQLTDQLVRDIVDTLIFTILVPLSAVVIVPYILLASGVEMAYEIGNFRFIGIVPILIGVVFYFWAAMDLVNVGKGTPALIDAPVTLLSRRLYWVVINPMYTDMILTLVSESVLFMSGGRPGRLRKNR